MRNTQNKVVGRGALFLPIYEEVVFFLQSLAATRRNPASIATAAGAMAAGELCHRMHW